MIPLEVAPGLVSTPNPADNSMSWRDGNLIRWDEGVMAPFGPWEKLAFDTAFTSPVRAIISWQDLENRYWTAYLTEDNLYVEYEGDIMSIAPAGGITPPSSGAEGGGYGDGIYSADDYGTPRIGVPNRRQVGPAFTMEVFGQDLLAMSSYDGRLIRWQPAVPPEPATFVEDAPLGRLFTVTAERHVKIFGISINEFAWSDEEDVENWTFDSIDSKAGTLPIEPFSPHVAAVETLGLTLIFTSIGAYTSTHIGGQFIYNIQANSEGNVPLCPGALAAYSGGAVWVSQNGWWTFNGVSVSPLGCEIWSKINKIIDWDVAKLTAKIHVHEIKSEIWFMFPERGSLTNTHIAVYSYRGGWWSFARISRTCGSKSAFPGPPLVANGTDVYRHESGISYPDTDEYPWVESFAINVVGGGLRSTFRQMLPSVEGAVDAIRFVDLYSDDRMPLVQHQTPNRRVQSNGLVDFLATGRDHRLRVVQTSASYADWTLGDSMVDIMKRGRKR